MYSAVRELLPRRKATKGCWQGQLGAAAEGSTMQALDASAREAHEEARAARAAHEEARAAHDEVRDARDGARAQLGTAATEPSRLEVRSELRFELRETTRNKSAARGSSR